MIYRFSPALISTSKLFPAGGNGQVAYGVNAHGGFSALLKSRMASPFTGFSA
jgi:hypothetical protein